MQTRVAIAGGGLAGLTCAKDLADAGYAVSVFEAQPHLGGRAATFRDADGDWVEQGLHVFFGVYSEFKALLRDIGRPPDDVLRWTSRVRFQDPGGADAVYGINPLRAPVRTLARALTQNRYLGPLDKLSALPFAAPALLDAERLRALCDDRTVTAWWRRVAGTDKLLERAIRPLCRALHHTDAEQLSAYALLGLLHQCAYDLPHALAGAYRGPRDETVFRPLARYLANRGVAIRTGVALREVGYTPGAGVTGFTLAGGERVHADAYVLALPVWALLPLVPPALRAEPYFAGLAALPVCPAISVQLWLDRRVARTPEFTLVARSRAALYQDQATTTYPYATGSRLSFIVAPADDLLGHADADLVALVMNALRSVQPAAVPARVLKSVVLRHGQHLVRPLPGALSARPDQATPVPHLFVAGDWTQQAFFGTQEGAVRAGRACAAAVKLAPVRRPRARGARHRAGAVDAGGTPARR